MARGLEHLGVYGFSHNDMKAENVLLFKDAQGDLAAKITDLGCALSAYMVAIATRVRLYTMNNLRIHPYLYINVKGRGGVEPCHRITGVRHPRRQRTAECHKEGVTIFNLAGVGVSNKAMDAVLRELIASFLLYNDVTHLFVSNHRRYRRIGRCWYSAVVHNIHGLASAILSSAPRVFSSTSAATICRIYCRLFLMLWDVSLRSHNVSSFILTTIHFAPFSCSFCIAHGDMRQGHGTTGGRAPEGMLRRKVPCEASQDVYALAHLLLLVVTKLEYKRDNMWVSKVGACATGGSGVPVAAAAAVGFSPCAFSQQPRPIAQGARNVFPCFLAMIFP